MPPTARSQRVDESTSDDQSSEEPDEPRASGKKYITVYDAVAGRAVTGGFAKNLAYGQEKSILTPEEALFKSKSAPQRFAEDDFYWANRHLPPDILPESDLLEAIHVFAADYYQATTTDHGKSDTKSLDASALLALGILLEESAREVLGETGDMAFVEGQPPEHGTPAPDTATDMRQQTGGASFIEAAASGDEDSLERKAKRQRL